MIARDQPTIFTEGLTVGLSAVEDGNQKNGVHGLEDEKAVFLNRQSFLKQCGVQMEQTVLVKLSYDKDDFCVYHEVSSLQLGEGMTKPHTLIADALVTREKGVALFLPIADCCPLVLHDISQDILMLSHLGRHSVEQFGAQKSVEYLVEHYGTSPENIVAWLGPAAGKQTYPLFAFDHRSLHEVIYEQLVSAGVGKESIEKSPIDVTQSEAYYSHSEFLKGHREADGRFAVVAMLK